MTDNEIIKALEIHADNKAGCSECPIYHSDTGDTCAYELAQNALDLINRQKAEIERLQKAIKVLDIMTDQHEYDRRKAKAEAVKEFAERLKERFLNLEYRANTTRKTLPIAFVKDQMDWIMHEVSVETIDNLAKKMVGENND